jgi:hypothetical protein
MRAAFSIIVGLAFTVAFVTFFVVHSVLSYLTSPTAIVDAAKAAETRTLALDAVQRLVGEQLANEHPAIETAVMARARTVIDDTVSSEWFYDTLADTYPGLVTFVETGDDTKTIDLRETKERLRTQLGELGASVENECAEVIGAAACSSSSELRVFMGKYNRAVDRAIGQIPEQTTLRTLLQDAGARALVEDSPEVARARKGIQAARTARWVSAVVMLALLGLLIMLNAGKLQRAVLVVGLVLVFASIAHFITIAAVDGPVRDAVSERIEARRAQVGGHSDVVEAGQKLVLSMAERSVGDQNGTVGMILFLGVACVGGAVVLGLRRSRS